MGIGAAVVEGGETHQGLTEEVAFELVLKDRQEQSRGQVFPAWGEGTSAMWALGWGRAEAGGAVQARSPRALHCCAKALGFWFCAPGFLKMHTYCSPVLCKMVLGASQMDVFCQ